MRRSIFLGITPLLAAVAVMASTNEAHAGVFLGAEFDGAQAIGARSGTKLGYGFLGMGGYRIGLGPVYIQPEVQGGYQIFPVTAESATHVARILGGARFGLSGIVQPAIFGHAGVGWLASDTNGRSLDVGLALGLKLIPFLRFGVQAAYNVVTISATSTSTKWVSFGAHGAIEF